MRKQIGLGREGVAGKYIEKQLKEKGGYSKEDINLMFGDFGYTENEKFAIEHTREGVQVNLPRYEESIKDEIEDLYKTNPEAFKDKGKFLPFDQIVNNLVSLTTTPKDMDLKTKTQLIWQGLSKQKGTDLENYILDKEDVKTLTDDKMKEYLAIQDARNFIMKGSIENLQDNVTLEKDTLISAILKNSGLEGKERQRLKTSLEDAFVEIAADESLVDPNAKMDQLISRTQEKFVEVDLSTWSKRKEYRATKPDWVTTWKKSNIENILQDTLFSAPGKGGMKDSVERWSDAASTAQLAQIYNPILSEVEEQIKNLDLGSSAGDMASVLTMIYPERIKEGKLEIKDYKDIPLQKIDELITAYNKKDSVALTAGYKELAGQLSFEGRKGLSDQIEKGTGINIMQDTDTKEMGTNVKKQVSLLGQVVVELGARNFRRQEAIDFVNQETGLRLS